MSRLTAEEHAAGCVRTDEEITAAFRNLIDRKGTMSIPVQREDDDIVIGDALRELRALRLVREDAETLLRIIGKRGLYPDEDEWNLIVNCAHALRDALHKAPVQHTAKEEK